MKYQGQLKEGKMHGLGYLTHQDWSYKGHFKDGKLEGFGVFTYSGSGDVYTGHF
jgi:hypothetical protein